MENWFPKLLPGNSRKASVNILKRAFATLPKWPWRKNRAKAEAGSDDGSGHLELARESLRELIDDARLPDGVRDSLAHDYDAVEAMLDKLEHGHLHLAAFGRVSTGKSSLLNALVGEQAFAVSPLHGETRQSSMQAWTELESGGVYLIDTPGLDEAGGEGSIVPDNLILRGSPAQIVTVWDHSDALLRIDAGDSVTFYYRVDPDDILVSLI